MWATNPCLYLKLDTSGADASTRYPLHNGMFDVDESCLEAGVLGAAGILLDYLGAMGGE